MFERIKFRYGGVFSGPKRVEAFLEDDKIYVKVVEGFYPTPEKGKGAEAEVDTEEWTRKLRELAIENWKERYQGEQFGGESKEWELEYKDSDLPWLARYGKNRYPDNFNELLELLNEIAGREVFPL